MGRTVLLLVLLVGLHGLVGSGTANELVAETGLVLLNRGVVVGGSLFLARLWTSVSLTDSRILPKRNTQGHSPNQPMFAEVY